jgi:peptidylprolyl isomerase
MMKPKITDRIYFDVSIEGSAPQRITIGLFGKDVPITTENFRALCTGEKGKAANGKALHYKGRQFRHGVPGVTVGAGSGSGSIYGGSFDEEKRGYNIRHTQAGMLYMKPSSTFGSKGPRVGGTSKFGSYFLITLAHSPQLDGKYVVFGRIVNEDSLNVLQNISISKRAVIADCGELSSKLEKGLGLGLELHEVADKELGSELVRKSLSVRNINQSEMRQSKSKSKSQSKEQEQEQSKEQELNNRSDIPFRSDKIKHEAGTDETKVRCKSRENQKESQLKSQEETEIDETETRCKRNEIEEMDDMTFDENPFIKLLADPYLIYVPLQSLCIPRPDLNMYKENMRNEETGVSHSSKTTLNVSKQSWLQYLCSCTQNCSAMAGNQSFELKPWYINRSLEFVTIIQGLIAGGELYETLLTTKGNLQSSEIHSEIISFLKTVSRSNLCANHILFDCIIIECNFISNKNH